MGNPRYAQVVRVAELYYERNLNQREIADILGSSISTVSRLLAEAHETGIVEIRINRPIEKMPVLSEKLRAAFDLRDAVVVTGDSIRENALATVGSATAELLLSIIENDMTIGITWGRPTHSLVQSLSDVSLEGIKVIQMVGSLGEGDPAVDGPELVLRLAERLHGRSRYVHAPAVVENKELCQKLLEQPQISETIQQASQANIMITGIGSMSDDDSGLSRAGYLSKEEQLDYVSQGAVGHILARMFDIQGNELVHFNERVVGLTFEQLSQAEWSICICEAAWKAEAVLGALYGQLFNTIVITDDAARRVLDIAKQQYNTDGVAAG